MKIFFIVIVATLLTSCATTVMVENKTCKSKVSDGNGNPVISECKKIDL